jgi:two-component system sensor kinase FixL
MTGRRLGEAALFLIVYVTLDRISFIHQFSSLSITPWNPPAGLVLALLLIRGPRLAPLVFLAALLADMVIRNPTSTLVPTLASSSVIALVYGGQSLILRRHVGRNFHLIRLRDVVWLAVSTALAALLVATLYVAAFTWAGLLPADRFVPATARYWIGDMIGIAVVTPLILVLRHRRDFHLPPRIAVEAAAQALTIALALWLVFGFRAADEFRLFYLLFLPLIWAAARFGITGAVLANLGAQIGLIFAFQSAGHESTTVTSFQLLMLVLAAATLVLGATVSEGRRTAALLQARQVELAHISRLSVAGELAAALAHELNQPLLATMAFVRAAQRLIEADPDDQAKARGAMDRAVKEAQRAGDIIKSLRQFIGQDRLTREAVTPADLVADAVSLAVPEARRLGIPLIAMVDKGLAPLHVDRVQVQQVLVNLVRNALDALARTDIAAPAVTIAAQTEGSDVVFEVADGGPGIADEVAERLFEPFNTSKATGMGLGLSICRTLVEAHGGRLWLKSTGTAGTIFRFSLPMQTTETE